MSIPEESVCTITMKSSADRMSHRLPDASGSVTMARLGVVSVPNISVLGN